MLTTTEALAASTGMALGWEVVLTRAQAQYGVSLIAGDGGAGAPSVLDCDPSNNAVSWGP